MVPCGYLMLTATLGPVGHERDKSTNKMMPLETQAKEYSRMRATARPRGGRRLRGINLAAIAKLANARLEAPWHMRACWGAGKLTS